jgi:hypothetical protein
MQSSNCGSCDWSISSAQPNLADKSAIPGEAHETGMHYLYRVGIDHSSVIMVALLIILVDHYNLQSEFTTSVTVPQAKSKSGFVFFNCRGAAEHFCAWKQQVLFP